MLKIKPLTPKFGAELSGVDISRPLTELDKQAILDAQGEWGVCVFRGTGLDNDSHIEFSRIFGLLERAPLRKGAAARHRQREIFDAGNLTPEGEILRDEARIRHKKGDQIFHHDSSFMALRAAYSLLLCHEAPEGEGPTWFADMRSAYADLPRAMKARLANLECEHSIWWSRKQGGVALSEDEIDARGTVRHPVAIRHEPSGRKALYVGAHARDVVGMERTAGRKLIAELNAWASQDAYTFAVYYQPGDLVIWDNFASMHRAGEFDHLGKRRDMRRTTVREHVAGAQPDDPYAALFDLKVQTNAGT